jgi:general nucleoside transport system permease protein
MIEFLEAAIRIATPLMFAALGGILSERAGVFAVGLEGMMLMGAFGGAIGAWVSGSAVVGVALAIRRSGSSWRLSPSPIERTTWSRVSLRIFWPQG